LSLYSLFPERWAGGTFPEGGSIIAVTRCMGLRRPSPVKIRRTFREG
jgi:hypothetical protein